MIVARPRATRRDFNLTASAFATALAAAALLSACGGSDDSPAAALPEETRPQDARVFTPTVEATFAAQIAPWWNDLA